MLFCKYTRLYGILLFLLKIDFLDSVQLSQLLYKSINLRDILHLYKIVKIF